MEEEQEGGISLGEIAHIIGKKILWILMASVAVAAVAALIFAFVLSPRKKQYQLSFMIEYPGSQELLYPGTNIPFRYESMIYVENLEAVQKANSDFEKIDVRSMAQGAISIQEEMVEQKEGEKKGQGIYTVTVPAGYFKDKAQATAFLTALCNYSMQDIMESVGEMRFDQDIVTYAKLTTYAQKIAAIESQQSRLLELYDKYSSNYGDFTVEGKTLNTYRSELAKALEVQDGATVVRLSALKRELENNKYLCNESKSDVEEEIANLFREKERNNAQLAALDKKVKEYYELLKDHVTTGGTDEYSPFFTEIATLTKRNAVIDIEVKELYASIGVQYKQDPVTGEWEIVTLTDKLPDDTQFASQLNIIYTEIHEQAETCRTVITKLYEAKSKINFRQNVASEIGGQSWIMGAAIGFIGAFVIASIVFVCLDRRKAKLQESANAQVQVFPEKGAQEELTAEAAVTKDKE